MLTRVPIFVNILNKCYNIFMTGEVNVADRVAGIIEAADVPSDERAHLLQVFNRYGMACYVGPPVDGTEPAVPYAPLREITSPQAYLAHEHMFEFHKRHAEEFPSFRFVSSMFTGFVAPKGPTTRSGSGGTHPGPLLNPANLGLVVKTRDEVGFPETSKSLNANRDEAIIEKVVQVGSVIMFASLLEIPNFRETINLLANPDNGRSTMVRALAGDLTQQIEQAAA